MDKKSHPLTNEALAKKFKNNFELVNYAIQLAENMIKTGRDARIKADVQNRAMLVLGEITEGKDQFDFIPETLEKKLDVHSMNGEEKRSRHEEHGDRMDRRLERHDRLDRGNKSERRKSKFMFSEE